MLLSFEIQLGKASVLKFIVSDSFFFLTSNDGLSALVKQIVTLSQHSVILQFLHNTNKPSVHVYLFNTNIFYV
jgi:hypothetical protein